MANSKVKRGKEELRDFYENHYVCSSRPISNGQQQKNGIRDFYENRYQQQQAIYVCAIFNDATAAAINR